MKIASIVLTCVSMMNLASLTARADTMPVHALRVPVTVLAALTDQQALRTMAWQVRRPGGRLRGMTSRIGSRFGMDPQPGQSGSLKMIYDVKDKEKIMAVISVSVSRSSESDWLGRTMEVKDFSSAEMKALNDDAPLNVRLPPGLLAILNDANALDAMTMLLGPSGGQLLAINMSDPDARGWTLHRFDYKLRSSGATRAYSIYAEDKADGPSVVHMAH